MRFHTIWAFILGLVYLYIQLLAMPVFEAFSVIPNILIPWLVYLVWTRDLKPVLIIGFLIGLLYDTTLPESFGAHALVFTLMALATDLFRRPFEASSVLARMLTLLLANLIFHLGEFLVLGAVYGFDRHLLSLTGIAFVYDLAVSFIVFWTLQFLSRLQLTVRHE